MDTTIIESPKKPWLLYAAIGAVILLIVFLLMRIRTNKKWLKALQKKNTELTKSLAGLAAAVAEEAPPAPPAAPPAPAENQATTLASSPVQVSEMEAEPVTPKELPIPSNNPVIPGSLNYKIQPLEGEYSFNAISSKPNGRRVFCNLETIGMSEERELVFRLMQGNSLIDTTSRMWPVEGKEIGTILTTLLNP